MASGSIQALAEMSARGYLLGGGDEYLWKRFIGVVSDEK